MPVPMESILRLYLAERRTQVLVLAPSETGLLEPVSLPFPLIRAAYSSAATVMSEDATRYATSELQSQYPLLLMMFPSPDGPPYRSAFVFTFLKNVDVPWRDNSRAHASITAKEYSVATSLSTYVWGSDVLMGRLGYFFTGLSKAEALWRVARVETDFAGRQIFSLLPVRLATGLPSADFSAVEDLLLREHLEEHWRELQHCVQNYLTANLITAAKNIAETLVTYALSGSNGGDKGRSLDDGLKRLRQMREQRQPARLLFDELDLYLIGKLKVLHARTHSDRVLREGRRVQPELAFTVAQDITEVLISTGLAHPY